MPYNGIVHVHTMSREFLIRIGKIFVAATAESTVMVAGTKDLPRITRKHNQPVDVNIDVPDGMPYKYIVVGSSVNPGSPVRYPTDMLLTDADIDRMTDPEGENLKVIFDKGRWIW